MVTTSLKKTYNKLTFHHVLRMSQCSEMKSGSKLFEAMPLGASPLPPKNEFGSLLKSTTLPVSWNPYNGPGRLERNANHVENPSPLWLIVGGFRGSTYTVERLKSGRQKGSWIRDAFCRTAPSFSLIFFFFFYRDSGAVILLSPKLFVVTGKPDWEAAELIQMALEGAKMRRFLQVIRWRGFGEVVVGGIEGGQSQAVEAPAHCWVLNLCKKATYI